MCLKLPYSISFSRSVSMHSLVFVYLSPLGVNFSTCLLMCSSPYLNVCSSQFQYLLRICTSSGFWPVFLASYHPIHMSYQNCCKQIQRIAVFIFSVIRIHCLSLFLTFPASTCHLKYILIIYKFSSTFLLLLFIWWTCLGTINCMLDLNFSLIWNFVTFSGVCMVCRLRLAAQRWGTENLAGIASAALSQNASQTTTDDKRHSMKTAERYLGWQEIVSWCWQCCAFFFVLMSRRAVVETSDGIDLLPFLSAFFHSDGFWKYAARPSVHLPGCLLLRPRPSSLSLPVSHPATLTCLVNRIQSVLHAAARPIAGLRRSDHIIDTLASFHWLQVPERITLKLAVLCFNMAANMPTKGRFQSLTSGDLDVRPSHLVIVGDGSFTTAAQRLWNSLPSDVQCASCLTTFRRQVAQVWQVGNVPFHLKFALKMTNLLLKNADFDQYLLITSQPYELAKNVQL